MQMQSFIAPNRNSSTYPTYTLLCRIKINPEFYVYLVDSLQNPSEISIPVYDNKTTYLHPGSPRLYCEL
ncbi:hypothetical protein GGU45_003154 [Niabella hirudinis]